MCAQWVLNEMAREEAEEAEEAETFDGWRRNDDCSNPVASLLRWLHASDQLIIVLG